MRHETGTVKIPFDIIIKFKEPPASQTTGRLYDLIYDMLCLADYGDPCLKVNPDPDDNDFIIYSGHITTWYKTEIIKDPSGYEPDEEDLKTGQKKIDFLALKNHPEFKTIINKITYKESEPEYIPD